MVVNTELLRKHINESGLKYKNIAVRLSITPYSLQKKIDNYTEFKASEIAKICVILGLTLEQREIIFFNSEVDFNSTKSKSIA